nr:MAG TPA: hypothetical protein [Caudoviricetes sp.]
MLYPPFSECNQLDVLVLDEFLLKEFFLCLIVIQKFHPFA